MMISPSLASAPLISQWLDFSHEGTVIARTGKAELGQGIDTSLTLVVTRELGVHAHQVQIIGPTTEGNPDEGFTAGSMSVAHSATALRAAARHVRALAAEHGVDIWVLPRVTSLDIPIDTSIADEPSGGPASGTLRTDLRAKVLGEPAFLHDMRLPGQAFGRVVRPPFRGAQLITTECTLTTPGVLSVVIEGDFVGVVADTEIHAREAREELARVVQWSGTPSQTPEDWQAFLTEAPATPIPIPTPEEFEATADSVRESVQTYFRPYVAHGSIGTSVGNALWDGGTLKIWSHTQGVYALKADVIAALDLHSVNVIVHHVQGAGCYGHNPADDAAFDAAVLARSLPGTPVHVTWDREDELGWAPYGPVMSSTITSRITDDGRIHEWIWEGRGPGHTSRPTTLSSPAFLGYAALTRTPLPPSPDQPLPTGGGIPRNAVPGYRIPRISAVSHRIDETPLRGSSLRGLGAHVNVFAIESHMDELAHSCGIDPLEYRLMHLEDPRGRAVLERVAEMCNWGSRENHDSWGRGIAYARYKGTGAWCAVVADVIAEESVRVQKLWIAADIGEVVSLDGAINQLEGGALQSASWTLLEQVRATDGVVTTSTWEDYPIWRFTDIPPVETQVLDQPGQPFLGAGEPSVGPTAGALANAVFDAIGVRVRTMPLTPENIVAAMT